jgi:glycine cleavage system H lipoate-binding protein
VEETNEKLTTTPKLINSHSQSQGWYVKLKIDENKSEESLRNLMNEEQYQKYIADLKK